MEEFFSIDICKIDIVKTKDPEILLTFFMHQLGLKASNNGFMLIRYAILQVMEDPKFISVTRQSVYKKVSEEFDLSYSKAERNMRHAIETCWDKGNLKLQEFMFGYSLDSGKGQPTPMEFIAVVADNVRMFLSN